MPIDADSRPPGIVHAFCTSPLCPADRSISEVCGCDVSTNKAGLVEPCVTKACPEEPDNAQSKFGIRNRWRTEHQPTNELGCENEPDALDREERQPQRKMLDQGDPE